MTNYQTRDLSRSVKRTSAVESYHAALNLNGTVYPVLCGLYALLCVSYSRLSSFIAEQRSYALYCRGVRHSIALSTQSQQNYNSLTSAPVVLSEKDVVQSIIPVLSDADVVSLPMTEVSEEVKPIKTSKPAKATTSKSRRKVKVKVEGEVYTSAANANVASKPIQWGRSIAGRVKSKCGRYELTSNEGPGWYCYDATLPVNERCFDKARTLSEAKALCNA